jgi:hypothetical protein
VHTGRAREQAWVRLELAIGRERHPESVEVVVREVGREFGVHERVRVLARPGANGGLPMIRKFDTELK